jgi:hypothetical protein
MYLWTKAYVRHYFLIWPYIYLGLVCIIDGL